MADSTVADVSKMKVVDLRKDLKSRGLSYAGDKAELVARLQAAMQHDSNDEHADINLDSDEIDSDGVLDEDDTKSHNDFDDTAVETLSEDLVLADQPAEKPAPDPAPASEPKSRTLKRKIVAPDAKEKAEEKEGSKKIVLNRAISLTSTQLDLELAKDTEKKNEQSGEGKVKITAEIDPKTKMELRAKRFGLPVKMSDDERKEARKQRFGINSNVTTTSSILSGGTLSENMDKLKKRAERFGQSVSKIMTDIENKEKLEKRKAKFGAK